MPKAKLKKPRTPKAASPPRFLGLVTEHDDFYAPGYCHLRFALGDGRIVLVPASFEATPKA